MHSCSSCADAQNLYHGESSGYWLLLPGFGIPLGKVKGVKVLPCYVGFFVCLFACSIVSFFFSPPKIYSNSIFSDTGKLYAFHPQLCVLEREVGE